MEHSRNGFRNHGIGNVLIMLSTHVNWGDLTNFAMLLIMYR